MGKKKIQTILAVSAMVGSATIVGHQIPTSQNSTILFENSNNQADSSKSNKDIKQTNSKSNNLNKTTNLEQVNINQNPSNKPIDYKKDLKIVVTGINIDKVSDGSNNPNTSYQPENNVPSTGNIVTQNTTVTYSIHVSLRSASGRIYPVSGASLTANPIVSYMGIKNETPQEKEALSQLQQSIQVQLNKLKNLNSTSTFVISASFNVGYADWNAQILPNLTLNITTPNGEVISTPLNIKPLKETMQYTDSVIANPSIVPDSNNKHCHYLRIGINNQAMSYSPGVYNPKNQNAKTVTFTINNPDTKNITITPLNIPGLIKNADGTYTASIGLLDSGHNLFKITTNTNSQLRVPITVTPVKEELESSSSNINASEATKMNYYGGQAILKQRDFGCHFSMTQSSQTSYSSQPNYEGYNNNLVTFGSTMTTGVPGKYNVYTGSLVTNGEIVVKNANAPQGVNLINNGQVYCHLNDSAVNILKSGTPAQKAQIMEDIVSGNMSNIGVKYTSSELQTLMNEGKTVPSLNFTYIEKGYDGDNFNDGSSYVTVPTNGNNNPVISRTITFGDLQGTYSQDEQEQMSQELKGGQLPSDGVVENNGKLQGFILSPPNSYTDSDVKSRNIGQITDERYGNYSHGLSAAYNNASADISVTADNTIGSSTQTTTSVQPYSWFLKQHQFNVNIQGYGDGPSLMLNNTTITVNMGHSFKLIPGKPLYFGSAKLSPSDYSVEGDKLIIHSNKDIAQSLGSAPTITFSAQYTNTQSIDKNITLGVSLSGKNDGDGMVYQYNNKEVPAQQGGIPTIHSYKTQIVVSQVVSNQCIHSATDLSNGEVQLQDQVINNNLKSKTYYIAGEIPIAGSNNLPGNDGEPSTGGLSSELQTLNTGGAPTWVLPKSAMNSENEKILTTPNGNDLKGSLKYIESPNSGWIKYKPGMNLNNMIGYFTAPTVGPRDEFNMTYNVKLKQGDNPDGLPEVVNSAFKYYDVTDNIGSTSNIVNITTPGTDLSNNWISTVKEVDGGKLTQQDLDKTVTINGKIVSLKDFIGTGPDLDANYDNTPTKLMNEVTLSQDKEALAKLGYQLVNITVNGKVRDLSWFENTGIAYNTGLTEVIFNIKKIAPTVTKADTTVTENYSNGRPVVQSVTTSNAVGSKVNAGLPTLPEGYKVIKVTVNGKVVPQDEVPTTQSKDNQTIVYTIGKIPTYKDIVKVVDSKGNQVGNIETATGETGKETGLKVPEIPKGYHVVSITNGNGEKVNGVPTTFGDSDNTTIYHIEKDITDKVYVDVKTETGTIITPSHEVASGVPGSKISVEMPNIPSEYHIEKVLVNGKVIEPDAKGQYELPNTLSNNTNTEVDDHIEVIVAKTPTTTVEEKYQDGTSVVPNKTTVNLQGTKVNTGLPELPSGYKVIKVTVNGQEVPESEVPTVQSAKDQTIVYTIGKVSTDTVKVVDESNNQIGSTVSKTGVSGTETGLKTPTIPNGYHIINVTDNGKVITTGVPSKFTDNNQNIVYHIAKDVTTTVKEVYSNGEPVTPSVTTTNNIGAKVNTGLPELPKGYQVVKVTVNGKEVPQSEVPTVQSSGNQTIVYTIDKMPTDTVKVVDNNGNELVPIVSKTGKTGSATGLNTPEIPKGYHVVSITNGSGEKVNGVPTTFGDSDNTTIYHIEKDITDKVYVDVKTETGTIITPSHEVASGVPGSKISVEMPNIPSEYHIEKVLVNGKVIEPDAKGQYELPNTLSNNTNTEVDDHIEVIVAKTPTTTVEEKYQDGTSVVPNKTTVNLQGTKVNTGLPELPSGYKVIKVTVNGQEVPESEVPTVQSAKDQTIVYTIGKVSTDTVKVVDESNNQIGSTVSKTGVSGTETGLKTPTIPNGYHIINVTDNGKVITTGVPSKFTDNNQNIVYHIAKDVTTTVKEVYSNGEPVTPSVTTTNNIGAKVNTGLPELPKGYQVVKVTVNGQEVTQSEVPSTQGSKDQVIIYTIGKQPTDTIKVINEKGIQVGKTISVTGDTGSKTGLEVPTIPNGYHVVSEIINGKEGTGVPSTFGDSNTNIIYNIAPNVKDETYGSVVTDSGKILVPVTPLNQGEPGTKATVQMPNIPEGYKIVKVTINKTEVVPSENGKYEVTYDNNVSKEVDNKIVITVKHIPVQDTIKVMEGSKVISTTKTKEGMPGEDTGIQTPNIPNGYHIDKITVDGNTVTNVPKTFGDSNQTIIYHLTENKVNDIKADVVTESGQPLVNNTTVAEGPEGSDVTCNKTEIPEGYHLVKVEYNGKVISSTTGGKVIYMLPDTIPTGKAGQLTYVVAKNTSTVNIKVVGGPEPYSHTTSGTVGSNITGETPIIPKGYKVTNITVNGHTVSEKDLPKTYGNKTYNIVYHVTKIPTGDIQQTVVTTDGTVIEKPTVVASGEVGNSITVKPYTPPEGYHIVKVEIDGKELTTQEEKDLIHNLPNTINSPKTEVVKYVIAKDTTPSVAQKGTIIIKVVDQQNISVVPEKTYTGTVGDKTPNMVPTIPNGDTLQKITSGQVTPVSGLPDTFSPGVHIYVYHVIEHKGSLTYTINVNGQPIRREYLTGVDGQTASYGLPHNKDWKLENIIVDGKKIPVDGNSDYHGVYSEDGTQVIYNYKTVTPNVTPQPTKPVKPEHKDTPIVKPNKGDNTPSKGGNTTPSHDNGDHTPSKPNKGDNTPSGDVNHNGGNTTPSQGGDKGNTPNKGDNTPSKGGN
ncbi:hypothetical protein, partial [Clostridium sp.]|uniref:hypothetical protein n=1 Tax=Clostridium sp. TaxID=1506 RepID=UPI0039953F7A